MNLNAASWEKFDPKELTDNPFRMIGDEWMLVTAGLPEHHNTMTASWGGLGVIWGKNVATIYVRPQRYTYEFLERNDRLTLSVLPETFRKALAFCGSKSGRDYDKAKECGLIPVEVESSTAFEEARLILACRKLYFSDINPAQFLDSSIDGENYPGKDYHRMYICEITGAYRHRA